jgi:hypothetical protein
MAWRPTVLLISSTCVIPLLIFGAWLIWLVFCAYVATKHPKHASDVLHAAGRSFPFRRLRRRGRGKPR